MKISGLPLPSPGLNEQATVVGKLEAARAKKLLDRLEAAILAKAFRGELVPQDPADEPAAVLLDRIRAARAAAPKVKREWRVSPEP